MPTRSLAKARHKLQGIPEGLSQQTWPGQCNAAIVPTESHLRPIHFSANNVVSGIPRAKWNTTYESQLFSQSVTPTFHPHLPDGESCGSPQDNIDYTTGTVPSLWGENRHRHQASLKLATSSEVSQNFRLRNTDHENATRQLRQLSRTLDLCAVTASYEVREAFQALSILPREKKGSNTSSETLCTAAGPNRYDELQGHYRIFNDADAWKKNYWVDSERILRGRSASFTSHQSPVSPFVSPFLWLRDCVIASLKSTQDLWEFMPVRLALCDLGAPGWGEPWFLHSAVLLLSHVSYGEFVCAVRFFRSFGFISPYQSYLKCKVIFFCNRAVWPYVTLQCFCLFCFGCCSVCFVWFGSFVFPCLVVFSVSFASWRPIGLCTGPASALLLRPITQQDGVIIMP